jgi:deazaflavin-dependent oxidoreductase (nitroreductase family)
VVIPKRVARFNRVVTNRLSSAVAGWLPGFAIVEHTGRRSGRAYRTPLNAFRTPDGYVIALTYGSDTDWVKNVLAAGQCALRVRGQRVWLRDPLIVRDESNDDVPVVIRPILALLGVGEFLYLTGTPS